MSMVFRSQNQFNQNGNRIVIFNFIKFQLIFLVGKYLLAAHSFFFFSSFPFSNPFSFSSLHVREIGIPGTVVRQLVVLKFSVWGTGIIDCIGQFCRDFTRW